MESRKKSDYCWCTLQCHIAREVGVAVYFVNFFLITVTNFIPILIGLKNLYQRSWLNLLHAETSGSNNSDVTIPIPASKHCTVSSVSQIFSSIFCHNTWAEENIWPYIKIVHTTKNMCTGVRGIKGLWDQIYNTLDWNKSFCLHVVSKWFQNITLLDEIIESPIKTARNVFS